jgi:hypothetical protein
MAEITSQSPSEDGLSARFRCCAPVLFREIFQVFLRFKILTRFGRKPESAFFEAPSQPNLYPANDDPFSSLCVSGSRVLFVNPA